MGACNLSQKQIKSRNKPFLSLKIKNRIIKKNENARKNQKAPPPTLFFESL